MARPATTSVSGRGVNTPGPTDELEAAEGRAPGEVLQGHPVGAVLDEACVCRGVRRRGAQHHRGAQLPHRPTQHVGGEGERVVLR